MLSMMRQLEAFIPVCTSNRLLSQATDLDVTRAENSKLAVGVNESVNDSLFVFLYGPKICTVDQACPKCGRRAKSGPTTHFR